jgi:hypothetical protein
MNFLIRVQNGLFFIYYRFASAGICFRAISIPVQPDVMGASWHAEQRFDAVNERLAQFKHGFPLRSECEFSALFDR